jgi:hypothetical protein
MRRNAFLRCIETVSHRASQAYLVAHTMFYANDVRPAPQVELTTEFSNKELSDL